MHFQDQITKLGFDRGPPQWRRERLFHRQYRRNPRRCQRITVSGRTRTSAWRHPGQNRANQDPEDSIGGSESNSSPCALALQYNKLMAKGDHLGVERGSPPKERSERGEKG